MQTKNKNEYKNKNKTNMKMEFKNDSMNLKTNIYSTK